MPDLLPLKESQRRAIGQQLREYVDYGIAQIGTANNWWTDVERMHRNEMPRHNDILDQGPEDPGYAVFHVPFSQPRQDMLTAQVCTVVGKQNPYMHDASDEEEIADAKQDLLTRVWKDAGFEAKLRGMARIAGNTDLAIYRVCQGDQPGTIRWDVLHPRNFMIVPPTTEGIQGAACVGHRFNRRRATIDAMKKAKFYYQTAELPAGDPYEVGDPQDEQRAGVSLQGQGPDRPTDLINLWDLIVRLDLGKGEATYQATFNSDASELLSLREYTFQHAHYFRASFIGDPEGFYPSASVGRNLYPLQDAYNKIHSGHYAGAMMSALKMIAGPKLENGEKQGKYGFGTYLETDMASSMFSPTITFSGQPLMQHLQMLEKVGDQVARISQNTQGASITETATESSIIAAGVAVGLEEYIANFTAEFGLVARHTMELIAADYDNFAMRFGDDQPEEPAPMEMPL